ncbi:rod shape-determining protein MreC, partial [uncultured Planktosalinus sp.]|uniref:rod shape-determining protein MreC n=1 Tax=uncultured Planktosalinus sp. TaxID=1810935 RepID=UPI0030DC8125
MLLFVFSLFLTIQSHSYHKSKFVHSANYVTGSIYSLRNEVTGYFGLRSENRLLLEENSRLKNQLQLFQNTQKKPTDSVLSKFEYVYRPAEVINNSFSKANNYLTLKGGSNQGFQPSMGVVTVDGIVGITDQVSPNYTTVLSLLNSKSSISVALKESGHFGSLIWDGENPGTMQLIDISRQAPVKAGDTIITDGRSTIFPK